MNNATAGCDTATPDPWVLWVRNRGSSRWVRHGAFAERHEAFGVRTGNADILIRLESAGSPNAPSARTATATLPGMGR